ncbi:hypothetical protein Syun_005011 [Stephania yunnanensis]|uniref:Major facilitator superfamily (MFS) profile domain-containing protein n=1 Tax=Stephania yunnanensis TaxID=152371 RepID=A0AAP0Q324_9MAGN
MGDQKSDPNVLPGTLELQSPKKPKRNAFAFGCSVLASTMACILGYDVGVMSGAVIFIQKDLNLNDVQVEIMMGIINLYALIGAIAAGRTSDYLGRRYTIVIAATILFIGALLMGLAPNYAVLMLGRAFAGVAIGFAITAPVFIAEIAPASSRGFLASLPEVIVNFGILLGYVSNFAFQKLPEHLNWRVMLGLGAIPSVLIGIGILFMPESPRWLVMQGRLGEARRVLIRVSDSEAEAESRLSDIKEAAGIQDHCNDDVVQVTKKSHGEGVWKELILHPTPSVRRVLIAAVGIHFVQQSSGVDTVVLYSPRIFKTAGITGNSALLGASVAVGFMKTGMILVATFLLDRVGRRPLLLGSLGGMVGCLAVLATSLTIIDHHHGETKLWWAIAVAVVMALGFVGCFSIGLGPIAWVYSSEIFPLRLRAQGVSIGLSVNRVTSGVIGMTFLSLTKAITVGGAFFLFCGIAFLGWVFCYTWLPETQRRTLEEMDELFGESDWRSTAKRMRERDEESINKRAVEHINIVAGSS